MRVEARLAAVCKAAREASRVRLIDVATTAGVRESTIHKFETGVGWRRGTSEIVEAYEHELGLDDGELWQRAIGERPSP